MKANQEFACICTKCKTKFLTLTMQFVRTPAGTMSLVKPECPECGGTSIEVFES